MNNDNKNDDTIKHITISLKKSGGGNTYFNDTANISKNNVLPEKNEKQNDRVIDENIKKIKNTRNYKHIDISSIESLNGFHEEDIENISIGTYCKYVSLKNNEEVFNYGGLLRKCEKTYCLLMKGNYFFKISKHILNKKGQKIYTTRFFINSQPQAPNIEKYKNVTIEKLNNDTDYTNAEIKKTHIIDTFNNTDETYIKEKSIQLLKRQLLLLSESKTKK
jgi:hypothetical protein